MWTSVGNRNTIAILPAPNSAYADRVQVSPVLRHGRSGYGRFVAKGPGRRGHRTRQNEPDGVRTVARNRRARHDYDIVEVVECGIVLQGSEVKSLRNGRVSLQDTYAKVEGGELWLLGVHIPPYDQAVGFGAHDPDRKRKLLVHRSQIDEFIGQTQQQSLTLIPLSIYFKDGRAKVELALAKGRRLYDKRHALATREADRDAARETAQAMRHGGPGSRDPW
jgi:SsrA-binding protein